SRFCRRRRLALGARLPRFVAVGVPDGVRLAAAALYRHERFWCPALALRDLFHRPAGRDGAILVEDVVGLAHSGEFVAMLDQKPIGSFSTVAVVPHPHQHPTAVQLVAVEGELEVTFLETALRIVGIPITAVPELHRAAAILPLREDRKSVV